MDVSEMQKKLSQWATEEPTNSDSRTSIACSVTKYGYE